MAALIVQSRFAGLMIEDDDASSTERIPKNNKMKANNATKPEPQKKIKAINSKVQVAYSYIFMKASIRYSLDIGGFDLIKTNGLYLKTFAKKARQ